MHKNKSLKIFPTIVGLLDTIFIRHKYGRKSVLSVFIWNHHPFTMMESVCDILFPYLFYPRD